MRVTTPVSGSGSSMRGSAVLLMLAGLVWSAAMAAPPVDPLPAPEYSFDRDSPTVLEGFVGAADVLAYGLPHPVVVIPGFQLGMPLPGDELDSLSQSNAWVPPGHEFLLLFSVDRETVGLEPPDPELVARHVPYNALDQIARGHGAGDQFVSLAKFMRGGRIGGRGGVQDNNSLSRNNFDEGGTSFSAEPPTHARDVVRGTEMDNVDAFARLERVPARGPIVNVYFTLSEDSPSLPFLSGGLPPSGAHIFFSEGPFDATPPSIYAPASALQLNPLDDIDGLIVFDMNGSRFFDPGDVVLFSLTPDSPTLGNIAGTTGPSAGADVLIAVYGQFPTLFAAAPELGLGVPGDNIDALDFAECADPDPINCVAVYGIRGLWGDWDDDGDVDIDDFTELAFMMTGPDLGPCPPGCEWFDVDGDLDIDMVDVAEFQLAFTGAMP